MSARAGVSKWAFLVSAEILLNSLQIKDVSRGRGGGCADRRARRGFGEVFREATNGRVDEFALCGLYHKKDCLVFPL